VEFYVCLLIVFGILANHKKDFVSNMHLGSFKSKYFINAWLVVELRFKRALSRKFGKIMQLLQVA